MIDFNDCLRNAALTDHSYADPLFTWKNNRPIGHLARKLDGALVNYT